MGFAINSINAVILTYNPQRLNASPAIPAQNARLNPP